MRRMVALPASSAYTERLLATCAAVVRLGAFVLLAVAVPGIVDDTTAGQTAGIAIAAAESLVFAAAVLRAGRLPVAWVLVDQLVVAGALAVTSRPAIAGGAESPLFNFALTSIVVAGLVAWPWWAALGSAVVATAALLLAGPGRDLVPDSSAPTCAALITWVVARYARNFARAYDLSQQAIVTRAEQLAVQRERLRHGAVLQSRLLDTLSEVIDSQAITDPALAGQLSTEVDWLREVVRTGVPTPPAHLLTGLREIALERSATGLRVHLDAPRTVPDLPDEVREALVEATREALTNVGKHAGVASAVVRVTVDEEAVTVEIVDRGRGYDPSTGTGGLGLARSVVARMESVGGTATAHSALGLGTRIVLRAGRP